MPLLYDFLIRNCVTVHGITQRSRAESPREWQQRGCWEAMPMGVQGLMLSASQGGASRNLRASSLPAPQAAFA